ncbi:MAG: glutamine-hydrolyzing GMP synthase [Saprospiraceae bacterium]|nr:glutamine-hydrolyzing GMP synthase [Saprospiraceae bacterium]MBK7697910.1 glutamine-hydrolyzing GMP synthase [Saprospiraceae bacterium]MBK9742454.1 glutamine-hydrolyzing GMP synthase [Saprospiraceae bacterium]MBP6538820.1 glutamine-hydrolyzing GMP synthase [Saprospiraceae bacterium]MBP8212227.1 glutamine-hydrolyzing GMP synthase [Saprospiraceae bacterium]
MNDLIVILDFGSQYTQLIARRLRELNFYCEIFPYNKFPQSVPVKAVILSGSPFSVLDPQALPFDPDTVIGKYPVLGICYGAQLIAHKYGGQVLKSDKREYGKATMMVSEPDLLFDDMEPSSQVWMSHGDSITKVPENFEVIARTTDIVAAYRSAPGSMTYPVVCLQFHPEVTHSLNGKEILFNFAHKIAGCTPDWTPASMVSETVRRIQETVGDEQVMMGLSGGVDSTVAASLIHKAIGDRLHCIFIDNGLLRKDEYEEVLVSYEGMGLNIKGVKANDLFLNALSGVSDPEAKRKIIGKLFIDVFEDESHHLPEVKWLGQGTIYPDVIESVSVHGPSVTIKSHHNVGGLPEKLKLSLLEPLRMLFKDEVRRVGAELKVPSHLLNRHPFPGPGLGIRVLGEITREKVALCQEADKIYTDHLRQSGWYEKVWQAGAILLPVQSVGVMGDERTYEFTIALRCVHSLDGMTAEWSHLPYELLATISTDIINKVKGINRVVYDISTKPPATIEWE